MAPPARNDGARSIQANQTLAAPRAFIAISKTGGLGAGKRA
jgi:hypothetical protein